MNNLKSEKSAYLQSAVNQPVNWYPWCKEAFETAKAKNIPVLMDIGAVWCHWCHVIDEESYEDEETASIINDNFIAIKVDKDERPDIDGRYQKAVTAFAGQGGWPLTTFLTYEGYFFYGGTYYPKESKFGLPAFKTVLLQISKYYTENQKLVLKQSKEFYNELFDETKGLAGKGASLFYQTNDLKNTFSSSYDVNLKDAEKKIKKLAAESAKEFLVHFDHENGGLDESPKFYYFPVLELLYYDYLINSNKESFAGGLFTLAKIALGGVFDQVDGGFHRYSTDKKWIIPHFEKLASDNASGLRVYAKYYSLIKIYSSLNLNLDLNIGELQSLLLNAINKTLDFFTERLYDRINGGFYSSMSADVSGESITDDGSFYTWTEDELKNAVFSNDKTLSYNESKLSGAKFLLNFNKKDGIMPSDGRKVIYFEENAFKKENYDKTNSLINKLKEVRNKRKLPFIDKLKYASVNGNIIYALTEVYKIFKEDYQLTEINTNKINNSDNNADNFNNNETLINKIKTIAENSIKPFIEYFNKNGDVGRFIGEYTESNLEDNGYILLALIGLYEITLKEEYLEYAKKIGNYIIINFYDGDNGGFYDIRKNSKTPLIGFLNFKEKSILDYGSYSSNALAICGIAKLYYLTSEDVFERAAAVSAGYFISYASVYKYNIAGFISGIMDYSVYNKNNK
ncbi:MAG: thioredoxin domain-containing protein [bacterium]